VWKKELRIDSGGPGQYRGGLGQDIEIELRTAAPARLSLLSDRHQHPALGLLGGLPGAPSSITLDDGTRPHPKARGSIDGGRRLLLRYAGGGGFGDPHKRDPDAIAADLRNGLISESAAKKVYR
jgi:N-methylhydantoinase B